MIGKNSIQGIIDYYFHIEFQNFISQCLEIKINILEDIVQNIDKEILKFNENKRFQF